VLLGKNGVKLGTLGELKLEYEELGIVSVGFAVLGVLNENEEKTKVSGVQRPIEA
jgi:hypothetical protein